MRILSLLLLAFLFTHTSQINSHRNISTIPNPKHFDYSTDERILGVANKSAFAWYNAMTGIQIGIVYYEFLQSHQENSITCLDISEDGNWIGIGFQTLQNYDSYVSAYFDINKKTKEVFQQAQEIQPVKEGSSTKDVFFLDNQYFVSVIQNQLIIQGVGDNEQYAQIFVIEDIYIDKVQPLNGSEIMVVGKYKSNSSLALISFQYTPELQDLSISKIYDLDSRNLTVINDFQVLAENQVGYFVGDSNNILVMDFVTQTTDEISISEAWDELRDVQVSNDEKYLLTIDKEALFFLQKSQISQFASLEGNQTYIITKIDVAVPAATLSKFGGNIFYVNQEGKPELAGVCKEGEFANSKQDSVKCQKCDPGCSLCINDTSIECFQCEKGYYHNDTQLLCQSCELHCDQCESKSKCKSCESNYKILDGLCGCERGYFDNQKQCEECSQNCLNCQNANKCTQCDTEYDIQNGLCVERHSSKVWIIILSVILGLLLIGAAIVFVIFQRRKKRRELKSLLQTQGEEGSIPLE